MTTKRPMEQKTSIGLFAACLTLALGVLPAEATEIKADEPLVMRLIFEDCLGYIREGKTPFEGLDARPASKKAMEVLPTLPYAAPPLELLSPRYVAAWGSDERNSYCMVRSVWEDIASTDGLLGVQKDGFISRVSKRAIAAGITEKDDGTDFLPIMSIGFYEPSTGHDTGPLRPITFVILPIEEDEATGLSDAGLLVMGGPPRP